MKRNFTEALLALALTLAMIGVITTLAKALSFDDFLLLIMGSTVVAGILLLVVSMMTPNRDSKDHFVFLLALMLCSPAFGQEPTYNYITEPGGCAGFCGPGAIAWSVDGPGGIDQIQVGKVMDWQHYHGILNDYREDLEDSPACGKIAVLKLGFRYLVRTAHDITEGRATPNKTVILVHPDARRPFLGQHWTVLAKPLRAGFVRLHWGNGTIKEFSNEDFIEIYSRSLPACAYEIIPAPKPAKATIWNRVYDWFFRKIA